MASSSSKNNPSGPLNAHLEIADPHKSHFSANQHHGPLEDFPPPHDDANEDLLTLADSPDLRFAIKTLGVNMIPLVITFLADYLVRNMLFHLVKEKNDIAITSAIGIGNNLITAVGLSVIISLNTGLVSRSSQAFGARNNQLVGYYLHRAFIINSLVLIPSVAILYRSDLLFTAIRFEPELALDVQRYTSKCIPAIIGMMIFNTLSSYLYSCSIFLPSSAALITSSLISTAVAHVLFKKTNLALTAAAMTFSGMQLAAATLTLLYILMRNPVPGSLFWIRRQSFEGLWSLFRYELLVGSMVYAEWIAYQIVYFFTGTLGLVEITSLTIAYINSQTLYAVPVAVADGTLTFIGNAMGEGNTRKAKTFLKAALLITLLAVCGVELFYLLFARRVAEFYTADPATVDKTVEILMIYLLHFPADFIQLVLSSAIRALGREKLGSLTFLVCFYFIAIPASYALCFTANLRVKGLMYGLVIGVYCLTIWMLVIFYQVDWDRQVRVVKLRVDRDHKELGEEGMMNLDVQDQFNV